ncbi:RICIN domain-containing protein [Streptosporangium sp. NPDC087985]|uniref:RICIN domain-containing protein n=1 Tax=Streptosporangium sp. NPDC087985 TaxID=3366196 RepID=UPI00381F2A88
MAVFRSAHRRVLAALAAGLITPVLPAALPAQAASATTSPDGLGAAPGTHVTAGQAPLPETAARRTRIAPTQPVMLVNGYTGKCLTIAGGVSTANNVEALQYTCDTHPSRRWTLTDVTGTGYYQVRNVNTGKCLTIAGGVSTANNVTALQYDCDDHPSRRWTLTDVTGTGYYQITNVNTGKCLTIAGGVSTANNVEALQYDCDTHPSRRWTLRLAGNLYG